MPSTVCRIPVAKPAMMPQAKAARSASQGLAPPRISITATEPPRAKEPSQVISAKFRIRNVKYTPSAMMPQMRPCASPPGAAFQRATGFSEAKYAAMISSVSPEKFFSL